MSYPSRSGNYFLSNWRNEHISRRLLVRAERLKAGRQGRQRRRINRRINAAILLVSPVEVNWNEQVPVSFDIQKLGRVVGLDWVCVDFMISEWEREGRPATFKDLRLAIQTELDGEYQRRDFDKHIRVRLKRQNNRA